MANQFGWHTDGPVAVTIAPRGSAGGAREIYYTLRPLGETTVLEQGKLPGTGGVVNITRDGKTSIKYYGVDALGLRSIQYGPWVVRIDSQPPTISQPVVAPVANSTGWHRGEVRLTANCSDSHSTAVQSQVTATVTTEGQRNVELRCEDYAGNSAVTSVPVKLEKAGPQISGLPQPSCTLSPANGRRIEVGLIAAAPGISGLAAL